jgi:two-component system cell cycle sensor histidine kinase/response regulator CckA
MGIVATEPAGAQSASARAGRTILVVEDQPEVLELLADALQMLGYHVLTAGSPSQGLAIGDQHAREIDLVLTDVIMPEMNGPEFAHQLTIRYPTLKVLYVSGHGTDMLEQLGVPVDGSAVLRKPFTLDTLLACVSGALEMRAAARR